MILIMCSFEKILFAVFHIVIHCPPLSYVVNILESLHMPISDTIVDTFMGKVVWFGVNPLNMLSKKLRGLMNTIPPVALFRGLINEYYFTTHIK